MHFDPNLGYAVISLFFIYIYIYINIFLRHQNCLTVINLNNFYIIIFQKIIFKIAVVFFQNTPKPRVGRETDK